MRRGTHSFLEIKERTAELASAKHKKLSQGFALFGSGIFVLSILEDKPKLGILISAVAAVSFLFYQVFRLVKTAKSKEVKVDIQKLRSHQVSRYLPWITEQHRGHDAVVKRLLKTVDRELSASLLGKTLGFHLIAGPSGTGKSQLISCLTQCLFGAQNSFEFNFQEMDEQDFEEAFLALLKQVQDHPYQVIILKNLDQSNLAALDAFLPILKTGKYRFREGVEVSFAACLFLGTLRSPENLKYEDPKNPILAWIEQQSVLSDEWLHPIQEWFFWGSLPPNVMAEISGNAIINYWQKHEIKVYYLDPKLLLGLIEELSQKRSTGLHRLTSLIRNHSASALEYAMQQKLQSLSLFLDQNQQWNLKIRRAA